jgi:hypothetical protein
MTPTLLLMLNDAEQQLVRESQPDRLRRLDEDELLDLHTRVRRARTKYIRLHRRRGAAQVQADASRTRASAAAARTAAKAEVFEEVLSDVSRQLARLAKESAAALKTQRVEDARRGRDHAGASTKKTGTKTAGARAHATPTRARTSRTPARSTPIGKKRSASTRSATSKAQARADRR